jgi:ferredoxin
MTKHGARMMAPSGYAAQVDANRCLACGNCVDSCPFHARSLKETSVVLDWEKCMGCGVCVGQCPNAASSLVRDEGKGVPLDVRLLA